MIDHCYTERDKELEQKAIQYYVTETLHLMGKNIAAIAHGEHLKYSWKELCEGITDCKDQKDGDEIARDVVEKAGLSYRGD